MARSTSMKESGMTDKLVFSVEYCTK